MSDQDPVTQSMTLSDLRGQLGTLVDRVARREARVVVEERGVPVAAIVSAEDLRRLDQFERDRAARFAIIDEVRAAFADVPVEEIERETDRILGINQEESHEEMLQAAHRR